jgi:hypothetical protein
MITLTPRTEGVGGNKQLDYIIIPASAAIVATVIIAVIIFIACLKTSSKKRKGKVSVAAFFNMNLPLWVNLAPLGMNFAPWV